MKQTALAQLQQFTTIVADSGDLNAIATLRKHNALPSNWITK